MAKVVEPAKKAKIVSLCCDRCDRLTTVADEETLVENGEFFSIEKTVGYFSNPPGLTFPWGDGDKVSIDLCERCMFELLGSYVKVEKALGY